MGKPSKRDRDARSERGGASDPPAAAVVTAWSWHTWIIFNGTVFVAAACIMTVEILSTRLVARYLGSSIYTWTSAIGVVLAGISLGNYIGGRLADRFHPRRTLSVLFLASSASCVTIPIVNSWIGVWSALDDMAWPTRIFLHFTLAFLLPSTMLGTMSPVVAKMALDLGRGPGRTVGTIYAWGSIGSIVGTFVAGFFLVAWLGTEASILLIAGVLALVGILYGYRSWVPYSWAAVYVLLIACLAVPWAGRRPAAALLGLRDPNEDWLLFKSDSQYQRVTVVQTTSTRRRMLLDSLVHSIIDLADPLALKYEYESIYAEVMRVAHPSNEPVSALFIGGGGYVFPRYVEIAYPDSHLEVAEIDPEVTRAAHETFGLPRNTTIRAYDMDARNHVSDLVRRQRAGEDVPAFDFVFGDAFQDLSVPFHLTTLEFNRMLGELMSDDGVYMLNLIDILDSGRFLSAVINTCREIFPYVYVTSVGAQRSERDTFVIVSARRPLDLTGIFDAIRTEYGFDAALLDAEALDRLARANGDLVLTDDFAPVENLLAPVVRRYTRPTDDVEPYADEITSLLRRGDDERAIARCREVLAENPGAPRVWHWMGQALHRQGRYREAIDAFRAELRIDPQFARSHVRIADALDQLGDATGAVEAYRAALGLEPDDAAVRCSLAAVLVKLGERSLAEQEYREAIRLSPGMARAHLELANLYYNGGDVASSVPLYEQAFRLNPDYPALRYDLAVALLETGRAGEAIGQLQHLIDLDPTDAAPHNQLGRALAGRGDVAAAADSFGRAVQLDPANARYRSNLALACEELGRHDEAARHYRACLRLDESNLAVLNALAKLLATSPDDDVRDGAEALRHASRLSDLVGRDNPEVLDTLAAALAESGRYDEAATMARRGIQQADAAGLTDLATELRAKLALYEAGQPYRRK